MGAVRDHSSELAMKGREGADDAATARALPPYERPAIVWEEELPQGPNLFSACSKFGGQSEVCSSASAS
jgi:hypothetical protein